jgi:hypothetical protein
MLWKLLHLGHSLSGYILYQNKLAPTSRWRLIDHIAVLGDPALSCGTGVETPSIGVWDSGVFWFGPDLGHIHIYIYLHESN